MKSKYETMKKIGMLTLMGLGVMALPFVSHAHQLSWLQPAIHAMTSGAVATPLGTTYSISHQVGVDPDGTGGDPPICFSIVNPTFPGAPDNIVTYDNIPETISTDLFGTVPSVTETSTAQPDGSFQLTITTRSPSGTDLFPAGLTDGSGNALSDGCFIIGEEDPLTWTGLDVVVVAIITGLKDGDDVFFKNISSLFASPWNGVARVQMLDVAGLGINQVRVEMIVSKSSEAPANDDCANAEPALNGITPFTNVGATTDGTSEPSMCSFSGSDAVDSDVWFQYTASCTGDLNIDTCNSLFDTKIAVYDFCNACPTVDPPQVCNDDSEQCGPVGEQSRVSIPTSQNDCFTIRVGGFLGDQGPGSLRIDCVFGACCVDDSCSENNSRQDCLNQGGEWFPRQRCAGFACPSPPPDHDECVEAVPLFTDTPYQGSTESATGRDESLLCGINDIIDVWHIWEADCTGIAKFSLCESTFDTTLTLYDNCDGNELACSDDDCPGLGNTSEIDYFVNAGETYWLRVSGHDAAQGAYSINIEPCVEEDQACCFPTFPTCFPFTESECLSNGGTPLGIGTFCRGDINGNQIDDACEGCPTETLISTLPPQCSIDARYPHDPIDSVSVMGWNSIKMTFDCDPGLKLPDEFTVTLDPPGTPPTVTQVIILGDTATVYLDSPVPPGHWACFEHVAGAKMCVGILPGDVDQNGVTNLLDVTALIDHLNGNVNPAQDFWQCDIDRSGECSPSDLLGLINLFNGASEFEVWFDASLPVNVNCP